MFKHYKLLGILGEGTYGKVYKAKEFATDEECAIKVIKKPSNKEVDRGKLTSISTLREMKLLRELHHDNIVNMKEIIIDPHACELAMVFELATWTLRDIMNRHLEAKRPIPQFSIKSLIWQTIKGLQFMHENWIIHRDMKPENILVIGSGPRRGLVQIADLGLARIYQSPLRALGKVDKTVVTLWYRAPELLLGSVHYTVAVDVWSTGCMFAELCQAHAARALFPGEPKENPNQTNSTPPFEKDQCHKIFSTCGFPNENKWSDLKSFPKYDELDKMSNEHPYPTTSQVKTKINLPGDFSDANKHSCYDLLGKMLELNPKDRINATAALSHRYFTTEFPLPAFKSLGQLTYPQNKVKPLSSEQLAQEMEKEKEYRANPSSTLKHHHHRHRHRHHHKRRRL